MITWPEVPAIARVPETPQRDTFFTANRGSSEYGSKQPTYENKGEIQKYLFFFDNSYYYWKLTLFCRLILPKQCCCILLSNSGLQNNPNPAIRGSLNRCSKLENYVTSCGNFLLRHNFINRIKLTFLVKVWQNRVRAVKRFKIVASFQ